MSFIFFVLFPLSLTSTMRPTSHLSLVVHASYPIPPLAPAPLPVFDSLPVDVLHLIAGHLDARDLCSFEQVSLSTR